MVDKLDLSTKAQELRELLGEDANSPVDIFSLVSQIEGLTLVFYPLGKNISGMCVKDKEIKLIAINSTMSYGRQRFSLAHELYHLYYDDASGFNVCSTNFDPRSENEKVRGSVCLLLPCTIQITKSCNKESNQKRLSFNAACYCVGTILWDESFGDVLAVGFGRISISRKT